MHGEQNRLTGPDGEVHLSPRCMEVLILLAERAGEVVSREDFNDAIWETEFVTDDALTRHISELRRVLGDDAREPRFIETIPKRGYRLVANVQPLADSAGADGPDHESASHGTASAPARRKRPVLALVFAMLVIVAIAVAAVLFTSRQPLEMDEPVIAILPFESFGAETATPLVDGLHHDLLTRLSNIDELRVISRTSVKRYRDTIQPIPKIAAELGAGWILEGSVQQAGDAIQINAQLIDTERDSHVWARTYRRELTAENLFAIQQEIVEDIADSLKTRLTALEVAGIDSARTDDLESYTLYVQGRTYLDTRTEEGMSQALVFFRDALARDPEYALAWVGLSDALALLHDYGYREPSEVLPEAEEAIAKALELEPDLAEAHASLGLLHSTQRRGPEALDALKHAIRLRPNYAEAHIWLSWNSQLLGMPAQALESAEKAVRFNPLSPEAASNLIYSQIINGQIDEALGEAERIERLGLSYSTVRLLKGLALYLSGRFEQAADTLEGLEAAWADGGPQAVLAMTHIALGQEENARELLGVLADMDDRFSQAMVLAALGEAEAARQKLSEIEQWGYWPALAMHHLQDSLLAELAALEEYATAYADMSNAFGL